MRRRTQVRAPRILALVSESHMLDNELKSEAQFQRMLASFSDSPAHPRTPRAPSDRGRYPEEAGNDEPQRESTPSDEEELDDSVQFSYSASESIVATKPVTPAQSINGDDPSMLESPIGGVAMDVDMVRHFRDLSSRRLLTWLYASLPQSCPPLSYRHGGTRPLPPRVPCGVIRGNVCPVSSALLRPAVRC